MPSDKRVAVGVIVAIIFVSLLAVPATVAANPPTTTNTPTTTAENSTTTASSTPTTTPTPTTTATATTTAPPTTTSPPTTSAPSVDVDQRIEQVRNGPYDIEELQKPGVVPANTDENSLRSLGDPPMGFVSLRYRNPTILDEVMGNKGTWQGISDGDVVRRNDVQIYGSAFGEVAGEYTLEIVYWQKDTLEVGNSTVTYAANQTIEKKTVSLSGDTLYTAQNVSLRPHFDETWQATVLMKDQGGDVVARWPFTHRSNPSSAAINIDSESGAWAFAIRNAVLPGVASIIIGLIVSRLVIAKIGRGPGYGVTTWVVAVGLVGLVTSLIAYYQIAVLLANMPWAMGISMGVIAFSIGLTFHPEEKRIGFLRRELVDAATIDGDRSSLAKAMADGAGEGAFTGDHGAEIFDELTEALYGDLPEVPAVRTDDGYRVPVPGVKAAFARLFANAAVLDVENIATRMKIREGRFDDIITVDPDSDKALEHKPARLVRTLPLDTLPEDRTFTQELGAWLLTGIIVVGPPALGAWLFDTALNIPTVGFFVGLVGTAILSYSAEDGWIEFEPAPPHYKKAEDNLTMLQRAFKTAKEDQTGRQQAREERAKTAVEARRDGQEDRKTVTDHILDEIGSGAAVGVTDADSTPKDSETRERDRRRDVEEDDDVDT